MEFRESKLGKEIGDKARKEIEPLGMEMKKKYPEIYVELKEEIKLIKSYTSEVKKNYPELEELKKYAQEAGFNELLISPLEKMRITVFPLFKYIIISERYFSPIRELKSFAPDFLEEAIKQTFGNINEEIAGHEQEHLKGTAFKIHLKSIEPTFKEIKAVMEKKFLGALKLWNEVERLKRKSDFFAELQRVLRYSKSDKEVIDAIAISEVFRLLSELGIKNGLEKKIDPEVFLKNLGESPSEVVPKGLFPYLKERILRDVITRYEDIRRELREKYNEHKKSIEKKNIKKENIE